MLIPFRLTVFRSCSCSSVGHLGNVIVTRFHIRSFASVTTTTPTTTPPVPNSSKLNLSSSSSSSSSSIPSFPDARDTLLTALKQLPASPPSQSILKLTLLAALQQQQKEITSSTSINDSSSSSDTVVKEVESLLQQWRAAHLPVSSIVTKHAAQLAITESPYRAITWITNPTIYGLSPSREDLIKIMESLLLNLRQRNRITGKIRNVRHRVDRVALAILGLHNVYGIGQPDAYTLALAIHICLSLSNIKVSHHTYYGAANSAWHLLHDKYNTSMTRSIASELFRIQQKWPQWRIEDQQSMWVCRSDSDNERNCWMKALDTAARMIHSKSSEGSVSNKSIISKSL